MVTGWGAVGKSAMTVRFVLDKFLTDYDPTISDVYERDINIGNEQYRLKILDCAGGEDYWAFGIFALKRMNGILLVYDITSRWTFDRLEELLDLYCREKDVSKKDLPIVVCGNKCDLADQRQVESSEGKAFADKYGYQFFETSAKTGENLENVFKATASLCVPRTGFCVIC